MELGKAFSQEELSQSVRWQQQGGKVLASLALVTGVVCVVLLSSRGGQDMAIQKPINTMALPYMQPAKASQSLRYQPQAMPSRAALLQRYGNSIVSSPLSQLAVTAIEATNGGSMRDVSMMASSLDRDNQGSLSKVAGQAAKKAQEMSGITEPLGFFDPLGYTTSCTEGKLLFYREVELKHGRVAMLAALGIVVGEQFHPLFGGDIDVPAAFAFQQTPLETFWPAVVAAIAIPEVYSVFSFQEPGGKIGSGESWAMKTDRQPGDLGFDPLGLKPTDPAEFKEMQTKEINNGRLAMIAAAGMIAQELATGQMLFGN